MEKAEQQVLDLHGPVTPTFDNYITGPNQVLVGMLQQLAEKPEGWHYLSGAVSSGKTHLLLAVMHTADWHGFDIRYVPLASESCSPELINQIEAPDLLLLDDIHAINASAEMQEAVFHCLNRVHHQQKVLIISGNLPIGELSLQLADLKSRLAKCQRHKIKALGDDMFPVLIDRYCNSCGLPVEKRVVDYIVRHGPRNLSMLIELLAAAVKLALNGKGKITVRSVSDILNQTGV